MSVLHVLEVEALVGLSVFGVAYGAITLVLWKLGRDSERRRRERLLREPAGRD
ncbi:hypothetical protein GCM10017083_14320 [Thalassobaculum fulvum]|jgi:hypothetical protein|uniref:Heme exporter protein D n=1 Tax=Thalassobaculum fulvum TaxID=1633335 RepID=A0A918XPX0_9PROT|nr:hypothetical protein [Thalassobaculum fulvum]GHD45821.1 hypothetical protein GCM10017083_14320 [Thalassobaculum fulvum]